MGRAAGRSSAVGAALALLGLGGCANLTFVDNHHVRHVIGLVNMTIDDRAETAGRVISTTTLGVALSAHGAEGSGVALGYSRNVFVAVSDNQCIDLNTANLCQARAAAASKTGDRP